MVEDDIFMTSKNIVGVRPVIEVPLIQLEK